MHDLTTNTINERHSYLLAYYNEIKSKEIIAGQELITQLDLLIEDLNSPAYVYDNKDAAFRIQFIENFCKHTKSPFYGQPFILELWEKAFVEAFYSFKWSYEGYYDYYEEEPPKDNLRRFKKAILLIARKMGSQRFALLLV
ncbi:hypothetical protein [Chengkuizengella marina]|uniref:hypothetical protein n=1 Tax=Chengkuizengella marina TaxID=2507566 RepID=UPI00191BD588|nr:hypothetical protein [Chengkuizengella marina]